MTSSTTRPAIEPLLTVPEVCKILNIGRSTFFALRSRGEPTPPSISIGSSLRFRKCDVEAFIEERSGTGDLK